MRKVVTIIGAIGLLGMLAACEDYGCGRYGDEPCYGYGYGPSYYDHGPYGYGPGYYNHQPYGYGRYNDGDYAYGGAYDGFYDDFYGPFYDGYWAADGFFYFRRDADDTFHRDADRHFRHEGAPGFREVHGEMHRR